MCELREIIKLYDNDDDLHDCMRTKRNLCKKPKNYTIVCGGAASQNGTAFRAPLGIVVGYFHNCNHIFNNFIIFLFELQRCFVIKCA